MPAWRTLASASSKGAAGCTAAAARSCGRLTSTTSAPTSASRHIVRETILGVLIQTASKGTIRKAERAAQRAHNQPDAAQQQVALIKEATQPRRLRVVKAEKVAASAAGKGDSEKVA